MSKIGEACFYLRQFAHIGGSTQARVDSTLKVCHSVTRCKQRDIQSHTETEVIHSAQALLDMNYYKYTSTHYINISAFYFTL